VEALFLKPWHIKCHYMAYDLPPMTAVAS